MSLRTEAQWLASRTDLARMLHVAPELLGSWADRHEATGFPDKLTQLANGPVWDAREVIRWHADWRPIKRGAKLGYVDSELLEEFGLGAENGE